MEAILYDIEVTVDVIHGWRSTIREMFIPDVDLFVNSETCFFGEEKSVNRISLAKNKTTSEISDEIVDNLVQLVKDRDEAHRSYSALKKQVHDAINKISLSS